MSVTCQKCQNNICKQVAGRYVHYCSALMWDRTDPDQDWLHDEEDFSEYVNKERMCSEFQPVV